MGTVILNKIQVENVDGTIAEINVSGGGGDGTRPPQNSVGSAEIEDEGVKKEDLEKPIQDKLDLLDDSNVVTNEELEEEWADVMRKAMGGEDL